MQDRWQYTESTATRTPRDATDTSTPSPYGYWVLVTPTKVDNDRPERYIEPKLFPEYKWVKNFHTKNKINERMSYKFNIIPNRKLETFRCKNRKIDRE